MIYLNIVFKINPGLEVKVANRWSVNTKHLILENDKQTFIEGKHP